MPESETAHLLSRAQEEAVAARQADRPSASALIRGSRSHIQRSVSTDMFVRRIRRIAFQKRVW